MQPLNEFRASGPPSENDDHLRSPRIAMLVRGSKQATGQQTAAINHPRNEFWIHRQALPKLLPGSFGAALQVQQVRPRCFGIDVVRSQWRYSAPIVDAALHKALIVDFGEVGRRLNVHVAEQEARYGNRAQQVVGVRLLRIGHWNIGLSTEVLDDDFLNLPEPLVQALDGEQRVNALLEGFSDADQDAGGKWHAKFACVFHRLEPQHRNFVGSVAMRAALLREAGA